jgi:hypothetical protein
VLMSLSLLSNTSRKRPFVPFLRSIKMQRQKNMNAQVSSTWAMEKLASTRPCVLTELLLFVSLCMILVSLIQMNTQPITRVLKLMAELYQMIPRRYERTRTRSPAQWTNVVPIQPVLSMRMDY